MWVNYDKNVAVILDFMMKKIKHEVDNEVKTKFEKIIRNVTSIIKQKWVQHCRSVKVFKRYEMNWLERDIIFIIPPKTNKGGRPKLTYDESSLRNKRKIASDLSSQQNDDTNLLVHAASISTRKFQDTNLKFVLNKLADSSTPASKIREIISAQNSGMVPISVEKALTFLLENEFTKRQYLNIRQLNKCHNSNIFPSYKNLYLSKSKCRPNDIKFTERFVEVSLQNLLDHTAGRILAYQEEVFCSIDADEVELILSYGFDGSTGHSLYRQKFVESTPQSLDQSLFVTSVIPLKIVSSAGAVIWMNRTPQSVRFCRPLKVELVKETKDHILQEKQNIDRQILNIKPFQYVFTNGRWITVKYNLCMSLIDGKVLNVLTETKSTQQCPICGSGPKLFRSEKNLNSTLFHPKPNALNYGISPLHAWIRCFEFVLHLAYKLDLKKWQIRGTQDKQLVAEKKKVIQNEFWLKMGLHVDKPKANGSGTTNDGNTARRAFSRTECFAKITGIDVHFLEHLHTILIALSAEFELDSEKLRAYCNETAEIFFSQYEWYCMSATLHKILVHSPQLVETSLMPLGCLGENASEARNKYYKKDRLGHARKDNRTNTLLDMYHRAMDSSDPLISSISLNERTKNFKKLRFPKAVIELFKIPKMIPKPSSYQQAVETEHDSDNSDCDSFDSTESIFNDSVHSQEDDDALTECGMLIVTSFILDVFFLCCFLSD